MKKEITIVIPVRDGENAYRTLTALARQTFPFFDIVVVHDTSSNANWARNRGFELVDTEFVLFSDNDIDWLPTGIEDLYNALICSPRAYSYGVYEMGGHKHCDHNFSPKLLKQQNFISTMSLIRTTAFPGFDERIERLQDWDLWITMYKQGKVGVFCGTKIFDTEVRNEGITYNGQVSYQEAEKIIREKHNW